MPKKKPTIAMTTEAALIELRSLVHTTQITIEQVDGEMHYILRWWMNPPNPNHDADYDEGWWGDVDTYRAAVMDALFWARKRRKLPVADLDHPHAKD